MNRVVLLVDGFNLYHSLDRHPDLHKYKWLNLQKLAAAYLKPSSEKLAATYFFTSLPPWDQEKRARHAKLIAVYKDLGIRIVYGKFQERNRHCSLCTKDYPSYEEKLTDINIAVTALRLARLGEVDRILLLTADSDQAPVVEELREAFLSVFISILIPPRENAEHLRQRACEAIQIKEEHLRRAGLDDPHRRSNGDLIVKPARWGALRVNPDPV